MDDAAFSLSSRSAWTAPEIAAFLTRYRAPLRLAANTRSGFPSVCSLWFRYTKGRIFCATNSRARIATLLRNDPRCAFELAPNDPPYFGVRGQGRATLVTEGAGELLGELIDRYLGSRTTELARWLLARAANEVAICIEPEWLCSWDYSARMQD